MYYGSRNLFDFLNFRDSNESRLIFWWDIISYWFESSLCGFMTAWKRCYITFADPIRARWHQGHSRPTFLAMRASKFSPRENVRPSSGRKKGPFDQGQSRASIPLAILRRAIGGPSIPTSSNSYAMYFVRLFPPGGIPLRAPTSHDPRVSHLIGSILLHSRDEDFLRKTANYISEMHAVWSTLDEIARVRRAGHVEPPCLDSASVSFRLSVCHVRERRYLRKIEKKARIANSCMWLGATRDRIYESSIGDHETREKLGSSGSDRAGHDSPAAETHLCRG